MGEASREVAQIVHCSLKEAQWRQLMVRSINGESDKDLARAFGIQAGTISRKRYSDPVWGAAHDALKARTKAAKAEMSSDVAAVQTPPLSLDHISSIHPESVARFAHGLIQSSIEQGLIAPPTTISEFKALVEVVRKSCGLDDKTTNVNIALWSGGSVSPAPSIAATYEAEIVSQKEPEEWI